MRCLDLLPQTRCVSLALSTVLTSGLTACGGDGPPGGVEGALPEDLGILDADSAPDLGPSLDASVDAGVADAGPALSGLNTLYIGHSFGRPFAEKLTDFVERAGVPDHNQQIVFGGGQSGAPRALWEHPLRGAEIQRILDSGQVDVLVMICCSEGFVDGAGDPALRLWIDYALARNPSTRFVLALPWLDFPERYPSAAVYEATWEQLRALWHAEIEALRAEYPGVDIIALPHGRAAVDLRLRFEAGTLPEVEVMTGRGEATLFNDDKGHAAQILQDLGTLVWVGAIYPGTALASALPGPPYETDLVSMAETILSNDPYVR